MVKTKFATLAQLAPALALLACAAPKAIIVELAPAAKKGATTGDAGLADPAFPELPDDGIRLPDMLAMPGEGEFRASARGSNNSKAEANAVVARPPTDPPPRPKAKDKDKEKDKQDQ